MIMQPYKIFGFNLLNINPAVLRLQIHLPNEHNITYSETSKLNDILNNEENKKTMLTEYFKMNEIDPQACNYSYHEFPQYYVWNKSTKK
ncbi:6415_t:CDS:2 [Cetraspora pellucida]|uniref:6415_t:CDS:1 n=1 Tax=Cetraspora pellucida TaxID=1433469 RepID=A0ACA9KEN8_9GLOM|nr:6415_t:CDS:2 [Cetraspora pellucida]